MPEFHLAAPDSQSWFIVRVYNSITSQLSYCDRSKCLPWNDNNQFICVIYPTSDWVETDNQYSHPKWNPACWCFCVTLQYLFSGKQCVDVLHSIEICSVQRVLTGEHLVHKTQNTFYIAVVASDSDTVNVWQYDRMTWNKDVTCHL